MQETTAGKKVPNISNENLVFCRGHILTPETRHCTVNHNKLGIKRRT